MDILLAWMATRFPPAPREIKEKKLYRNKHSLKTHVVSVVQSVSLSMQVSQSEMMFFSGSDTHR